MENVLLTGCAGFIGSSTAIQLVKSGIKVMGVDNLNDYYDVRLKEWRLQQLANLSGCVFIRGDIEDRSLLESLFRDHEFDAVINLAARAGVRYSIENP